MIFNTQENNRFVEIALLLIHRDERFHFSILDYTFQYIDLMFPFMSKTGYLQIIKLGKWQH